MAGRLRAALWRVVSGAPLVLCASRQGPAAGTHAGNACLCDPGAGPGGKVLLDAVGIKGRLVGLLQGRQRPGRAAGTFNPSLAQGPS